MPVQNDLCIVLPLSEKTENYTVLLLKLFIVILAFLVYLSWRYRPKDHGQYDQPVAPLIKAPSQVSPQHADVVSRLAQFHSEASLNVKVMRKKLEDLLERDIHANISPVETNGVSAEWVMAPGADPQKRLLYVHGGAFIIGSAKSHRYITSELSRTAGVAVLSINYRMQPEFKTVHCHEDTRLAYEWIFENGPDGSSKADQVFVAGDSAGGNLSLSVVAWARDNHLPKASGVICLAPLTDATLSSPTWKSNTKSDPVLGPALGKILKIPRGILSLASRYTTGAPVNDVYISPLLGDLSNLPPTLIQVSCDEMLFGDSQRYANKVVASGGDVTLQVWPTMVHVFQMFGPELPEASEAFDRIAIFIKTKVA